MKPLIVCISVLVIGFVAMGCGPSKKSPGAVIPLKPGNGFEICLTPVNDGADLSIRIILKDKQDRFYLIKVASNPSFPRTHITVKYSNQSDAIWLHFDAKNFSAHAYYSYTEEKYIDEYGCAKNHSSTPIGDIPDYASAPVPIEAEDARNVYQITIGDENGAL